MFARAVLHGTAATSILATSREALGVAGEHVWPVPPLSLPEDEARPGGRARPTRRRWRCSSSGRGPRRRASSSTIATPPAVAEICRRLDGLPLAIELAAARVRALTPDEIARRIAASFKLLASADRAVDPRHRTLEATIDWSFDLLDDEERGSCCGCRCSPGASRSRPRSASARATDARRARPRLLMALVDRSLVLAEPMGEECRYRLLETVRQYGWERLDPAQAAELRELHARDLPRSRRAGRAAHLRRRRFGGLDGPAGGRARQPARRDRLGAARRIRAPTSRCESRPRSTGSGSRAADCARAAARWRARWPWARRGRPSARAHAADRARARWRSGRATSRWCAPRWRRASRCSRRSRATTSGGPYALVRSRHRAHARRRARRGP